MSIARTLSISILLLPLAAAAGAPPLPRYTADGRLNLPADYREWVYVSTGLDMSYSEGRPDPGHSMFDNVFVDATSWRTFKSTGHWPDGTMFMLEVRGASSEGSILKQGAYQTDDVMGLEVHVRDDTRFEGGWGFFTFDGPGPAKVLPPTARCYACHVAHGTVDTTFTQFYPIARAIAVKAGTYSAEPAATPR